MISNDSKHMKSWKYTKTIFPNFCQITPTAYQTLFTCWPSEALERQTQEPSARLAKLIRSCHTDRMFTDRVQS